MVPKKKPHHMSPHLLAGCGSELSHLCQGVQVHVIVAFKTNLFHLWQSLGQRNLITSHMFRVWRWTVPPVPRNSARCAWPAGIPACPAVRMAPKLWHAAAERTPWWCWTWPPGTATRRSRSVRCATCLSSATPAARRWCASGANTCSAGTASAR